MTNPTPRLQLFRSVFILVTVLTLAACSRSTTGPLDPADFKEPIKVACVGDSITQGAGASPGKAYPDQLQGMLGEKWVVKNYGVGGRTLLKKGDAPWWKEPQFQQAHDLSPDAVVIMLGTNDTKPQNFAHQDEFYGDYKDLVESFRTLPSKPHVWIVRPCPVPDPGNFGITEKNLKVYLGEIDKLADEEKVGEIDVHAALDGKPELFPDHVHPNNVGAGVMAQTVAHAIAVGK